MEVSAHIFLTLDLGLWYAVTIFGSPGPLKMHPPPKLILSNRGKKKNYRIFKEINDFISNSAMMTAGAMRVTAVTKQLHCAI